MKGKGIRDQKDGSPSKIPNKDGGLEQSLNFYRGSITSADGVIDDICEKASLVLYDRYLRPKVKPYVIKATEKTAIETT